MKNDESKYPEIFIPFDINVHDKSGSSILFFLNLERKPKYKIGVIEAKEWFSLNFSSFKFKTLKAKNVELTTPAHKNMDLLLIFL